MKASLSILALILFASTPSHAMGKRPPRDLGTCSSDVMSKSEPGDTCTISGAEWKVDSEKYAGKPVYDDTRSGLKVSSVLNVWSHGDPTVAAAQCKGDFRLPSGDPSSQQSDFERIFADQFDQVVPGVMQHQFWSSTSYSTGLGLAYEFDTITLFHSEGLQLVNTGPDSPLNAKSIFTHYERVLCVSGQ